MFCSTAAYGVPVKFPCARRETGILIAFFRGQIKQSYFRGVSNYDWRGQLTVERGVLRTCKDCTSER